jgi:hypothetical protein
MKNIFQMKEREIAFLDIVPANRLCRRQSRAEGEGFLIPYGTPWVPIISMRGKFPIGTYNLNGSQQASMLQLFKASPCPLRFASGTQLFFQMCVSFIVHSAGMAWLSHQTVSCNMEGTNNLEKVSLEHRGDFYVA